MAVRLTRKSRHALHLLYASTMFYGGVARGLATDRQRRFDRFRNEQAPIINWNTAIALQRRGLAVIRVPLFPGAYCTVDLTDEGKKLAQEI